MFGKSAIGFLTIATAMAANGQVPAIPTTGKGNVYYEFKGARLGMTLAEWKALQIPSRNPAFDSLRYGPAQSVCSGELATTGRFGMSVERSRAEQAANVLVCAYGRQALSVAYKPWLQMPISINEPLATRDVKFKFFDGRLYEISVAAHTNLLGDVLDGLTAKWGKPDSVVNDTTQNRLGVTFPHTIQLWANPLATIRLESPVSRVDQLNVTYATVDGAAKIKAVEKAINPDADKM